MIYTGQCRVSPSRSRGSSTSDDVAAGSMCASAG